MSVQVHVGHFLTGRIEATIPVTSMRWTDALNGAGSVECTVAEEVVRAYDLRRLTHGYRSFLAVEVDHRIRQAGPIVSRTWDYEKGSLQLGAKGLWHWLDRRVIRPVTLATPLQGSVFTVSGRSLGGIARALVERATSATYTTVPVVLPPDETGTRTESFPVWGVLRHGEQLRQITQRATDAPDIAFRPRRRADDPRFLEWVMAVGTEVQPALTQGGPDWVLDASAPAGPVLGISTDEDATSMGQQAWVTGNGMEEDILMSLRTDQTLLRDGWPLTEVDESRSTTEQQATLDSHADALLARSARPIEVFSVTVRAEAAREMLPGDHCRLITRGDVWLGDMDRAMRVREITGDLSDAVTLSMFPMAGVL